MTRRHRWAARAVVVAVALGTVYYAAAYIVLPHLWSHYEHEPGLAGRPMVTRTVNGIPGDPLNVGLVGAQEDAVRALAAAGWYPADAVTLRTSIAIAGSVIFDRPYRDAPVSPLFFEGKHQDFAFEKPVGGSADQRNHVRFWKALDQGAVGRPVWVGSATFDRGAGLSHYTGEITHHIAADIDAERNLLMADLTAAGMLTGTYQVTGIGLTLFGRNGGGDPYYTDGEIHVGILGAGAIPTVAPPSALPNPLLVAAKDSAFARARELIDRETAH
jgi:hypothetical protein